MMRKNVSACRLLAGMVLLVVVPRAHATFHIMQIEKVFLGVGGQPTAQAIQLRMLTIGQNLLSGQARLVAYDAQGQNPVVITTFPPPNPLSGICRNILIASDDFANVTAPSVGAAERDYRMDALIPESYKDAGSLTFEGTFLSIVYWRISWGGAAYTGPTTGDLTNDPDGEFGPPFPGSLSMSSTSALEFTGACPPGTSTNNAADYALSAAAGVFRNNAGDMFTIEIVVPTVSQWGIVFLALLVLIAGSVVLRQGPQPLQVSA